MYGFVARLSDFNHLRLIFSATESDGLHPKDIRNVTYPCTCCCPPPLVRPNSQSFTPCGRRTRLALRSGRSRRLAALTKIARPGPCVESANQGLPGRPGAEAESALAVGPGRCPACEGCDVSDMRRLTRRHGAALRSRAMVAAKIRRGRPRMMRWIGQREPGDVAVASGLGRRQLVRAAVLRRGGGGQALAIVSWKTPFRTLPRRVHSVSVRLDDWGAPCGRAGGRRQWPGCCPNFDSPWIERETEDDERPMACRVSGQESSRSSSDIVSTRKPWRPSKMTNCLGRESRPAPFSPADFYAHPMARAGAAVGRSRLLRL